MSRRNKTPDQESHEWFLEMIEYERFKELLRDIPPENLPSEDVLRAILDRMARTEAVVHSHRTRQPAPSKPPPPRPLLPYLPRYPGPPQPLPRYRYIDRDGHAYVLDFDDPKWDIYKYLWRMNGIDTEDIRTHPEKYLY